MVFNLVAASFTGVAISYAIGQSAPMSPLSGESSPGRNLRRTRQKAKLYLVFMFVFYCLGILLVAKANGLKSAEERARCRRARFVRILKT